MKMMQIRVPLKIFGHLKTNGDHNIKLRGTCKSFSQGNDDMKPKILYFFCRAPKYNKHEIPAYNDMSKPLLYKTCY